MGDRLHCELFLWRTPWWFIRFCENTVGLTTAFILILGLAILGLVLTIVSAQSHPVSLPRIIAYFMIAPSIFWLFSGLFTKHPEFDDWLFARVIRTCDQGKTDQARILIDRYRHENRISEPFYRLLLIEIFYRTNNLREVVSELEKCITLLPNELMMQLNLAIGRLMFESDMQSAQRLLASMREVPEWNRAALLHQSVANGLMHLRENHPEQALKYFEKALTLGKAMPDKYLHRPVQREFVWSYLNMARDETEEQTTINAEPISDAEKLLECSALKPFLKFQKK